MPGRASGGQCWGGPTPEHSSWLQRGFSCTPQQPIPIAIKTKRNLGSSQEAWPVREGGGSPEGVARPFVAPEAKRATLVPGGRGISRLGPSSSSKGALGDAQLLSASLGSASHPLPFPVKCDPPDGIRSNMSSSSCRIEWEMPEKYRRIWDDMQWQLQFRASHVPWEVNRG